ncbi:hypothetical protein ESCO106031_22445 [Escherichia coli]|nr:Uncharacterised protein [Escherichia coli]
MVSLSFYGIQPMHCMGDKSSNICFLSLLTWNMS